MTNTQQTKNWMASFKFICQRQILRKLFLMLLLGFSAGLPLLLIFSSLSLWLREAGIERSTVTYFSWAALGYSFKFIWAPLVDRLPIPLLTRVLGQRKGWLLLTQIGIVCAIITMASINPALPSQPLLFLALATVLLGFSSATQDVVIDAYRIESATTDLQASLAAAYVAGYRIGMLASGAGALYLASYFGSTHDAYSYAAWRNTYFIMATCMAFGIFATLMIHEPNHQKSQHEYPGYEYLKLLGVFLLSVSAFVCCFFFSSNTTQQAKIELHQLLYNKQLASFLIELLRIALAGSIATVTAWIAVKIKWVNPSLLHFSYVMPIKDFFTRFNTRHAIILLALIGFYRISDIVLGVISTIFYQDIGFSKTEIATAVKTFGLLMTILGGFLGGVISLKLGVMRTLFIGGLLAAATNLLFVILAQAGNHLPLLYLVISADNLVAGLASVAFVAFLSSLVNIQFTAMQYAIFSSLMTLFPKVLGGYSGSIVENLGYPTFFTITALLGLPVLWLIYLTIKYKLTR